MIAATAGHIDHGKTLLVKALTGIETDRLPEEKQRGLTIDLGFAYRPLDDGRVLGFVDVPGHERFVRTMIAGVAAIDYALLVVAADDGAMPQTVEHLAILDLLGIARGAVAITKCDKVSSERAAEAAQQISDLVSRTTLKEAPVFRVSAVTGEGVSDLRAHLYTATCAAESPDESGHFRLAVDRSFTIAGAGLVVTGAVLSGKVRAGDRVLVSPAGLAARVRKIHALNREAPEGRAGQRCALNLSGAELDASTVARGDWVVSESVHAPTSRIDARIRLLESAGKPLRHWTPVHVHLGAADVPGRVALLENAPIEPGREGRVQIVLDRAVAALWGDRFILRDQSAWRTIGGGRVIDPFAPSRGRARTERRITLKAMEHADPRESLAALIETSAGGVDLARFDCTRNLPPARSAAVRAAVPMAVVGSEAAPWGFSRDHWKTLLETVKQVIRELHEKLRDRPGVQLAAVTQALARRVPSSVVPALVRELVASGEVVQTAGWLRLRGMKGGLEPKDAKLWERLCVRLDDPGMRPPTVTELAEAVSAEPGAVERLLQRAARLGYVVPVTRNRFFLPGTLQALADVISALEADSPDGTFSAGEFRDKSGIGRNLSIEVMEYFDRIGFTRRVGDRRKVLKPSTEVAWSRVA